MERHKGLPLLTIESDNAGKFMGKKWTKMCQDDGVEHITSAPYAPSINSFVENVNRSLVEHASSMLWHSGVGQDFWALAIKAAAYLLNRSPHRGLDGVTPYELWTGGKRGMGHIQIWGCRAWAAVPKERRKKFESKSKECILVGFYDSESLYQLWDIRSKQLIKRRDVIFQETVMGHSDIARGKLNANTSILGKELELKIEQQEDLDELYAVVEDQLVEWKDIPAHCLPLHEVLVSDVCPKHFCEAIGGVFRQKWLDAINVEHDALIKNKVYLWSEVPVEAKVLPSKWIFLLKRCVDGLVDKYKAWIVAGGHKQGEGDYGKTFAPVAKFLSLRILLTMAALDDLDVEQVDVVTAFLHGELEEELCMRVPEGIVPPDDVSYLNVSGERCSGGGDRKLVWKLLKSLYGLKQSPRCFYKVLDDVLQKLGFLRMAADWGVWVIRGTVVILVYVDDMMVMGQTDAVKEVIQGLEKKFQLKRIGPAGKELFLGLQLKRDREKKTFEVSQGNYARQIQKKFGMEGCAESDTPLDRGIDWSTKESDVVLNKDLKKTYQAAIGCLIYLVLGSRPDLAFAVNKLAQFASKPTTKHWSGVKRVCRFIKGLLDASLILGLQPVGRLSSTGLIVGYFDAAFIDDKTDRQSTMAYAFFCGGSLVLWCSRKQRTIALSTTEAEYLAGTEATKEAIWIQVFLQSLGIERDRVCPAVLLGDNQGANSLSKNPEYHSRTKHIHGRQRFITKMWEEGKINVKYVPTNVMIADTLTKPLP